MHVEVWPNDDPEDLGHRLVAVGYDALAFRGFPCVKATIEYDGAGPRAWMGWLQVIQRHDDDGTLNENVDTVPLFGDESPLYTFGYLPTFPTSRRTLAIPMETGWHTRSWSRSPTSYGLER